MTVKFTLYGVEHKMPLEDFTELCTELCKSVCNSNANWKAFCEENLQVVTVAKEDN